VLKYSASLAYYTVLSLAPLLVIILAVTGFIFGKEAISGELYSEINRLVGSEAALQIQTSIQNIHLSGHNTFATSIGIIVLLIGATGIFGEIQDSLNRIWGLRIKARKVWWKLIFSTALFPSLLFLALALCLSYRWCSAPLQQRSARKMITWFPGMGDALLFVIDTGISLLITTLLFGAIFKVLPDARIKWRDVLTGAFITACLFLVGKYGIGFYLGQSNIGSIYGAAGSIMILMIWVYYSSAILYLGAVVTKVYATDFGGKIHPNDYSVWIKTEDVPVAKARS
jgi:membrane protein